MKLCYSYRDDVIGKPDKGNAIYKTLDKNWTVQSSNASENHLKYCVKNGFAIAPGSYEDNIKTKNKFQQGQIVLLDYDKGMDWEDAKANPFFQAHCMGAFTTSSHKDEPGLNRFRVLCAFPTPATSADEYDGRIRGLRDYLKAEGFVEDDPAMDSAQCSFGNPNGEFIWWDTQNRLPDIAPLGVVKREAIAYESDYTGTVEDSIQRVETWLSYIPNTDTSIWKSVIACLKNISASIGDTKANSLWHEFCSKDEYISLQGEPYSYYECENYWNNLVVGAAGGSFGTLKQIAEDHGFEPSVTTMEIEPADVAALFGTSNGYKIGNENTIATSGIDEDPSEMEIESAIARFALEPIARQIRMVIEELYGSKGKIKFNELTQEIEILGEPLKSFEFEDARHYLDRKLNILASQADAQSALRVVGNDNRYNPVADYLNLVAKQCGDIDLSLVATRCLGVKDALSIAMVKCWLVGAVSKALNNQGSAFTEVLTLVSPKGNIGKSEFFKSLASPDWFSDSFAQTDNEKDRILVLHSSWINEIAEVDQFSATKKDFKQMKGLLTTVADRVRVPYGRTIENKPRRCVLGATANETELYAADDEQRRFWTINVEPTTSCKRLDIQWLRDNRDEIWATATRLYQEFGDEAFKLSKEEKEGLLELNLQEFSKVSMHQDELAEWLSDKDIGWISANQVIDKLNLEHAQQNQKKEINGILKREGYTKKRNIKRGEKTFSSVWVNPSRKIDALETENLLHLADF